MAETWNETTPAGSEVPTLGDDRVRELKRAIRERLALDHEFNASESPVFGAAGSDIGKHKRVMLIEQSTDPTTTTDELCLFSKDDGAGNTELAIKPSDDASSVNLTENGGTNIRSEVVSSLNSAGTDTASMLVVTDASQTLTNKTINDPSLDSGSWTSATITDAVINGSLSGNAVLDEDDLASDSAVKVATQQSVKAYVDGQAPGYSASDAEIDAAADGIGVTIPRTIMIEIGDWDMVANSQLNVAHGLTYAQIVAVRATIRNDTDSDRNQAHASRLAGGASYPDLMVWDWDNTNVVLARRTGGDFDGLNYDSTSYNRGWVIIEYKDA